MRKVLKWSAVVVSLLFVGAQGFRPDRANPAVDERRTLRANTLMTREVEAILRRSCNDCHSSETVWPWYSNVAPASWFLKQHVDEGRRELSFSEWATYPKRKRERKLHEMCEQVESGEMPLKSYLPLHPEARLSGEDRRRICEWTKQEEGRQPEDPQTRGGDQEQSAPRGVKGRVSFGPTAGGARASEPRVAPRKYPDTPGL